VIAPLPAGIRPHDDIRCPCGRLFIRVRGRGARKPTAAGAIMARKEEGL